MSRRMEHEREFEEFANARTPALYRSAWLLCGDPHAAEDLVQETLAKVYAKWHQPFGRIDNPGAYAHTALTRTFLSGRRRRSSTGERLFAEVPETSAEDATEPVAVRLMVHQALAHLSPLDQAVVVLRYLEDLSVEETARRLGLSPGAVKNRSSRSMHRLRDLIAPGAEHVRPLGADDRPSAAWLWEGAERV